MGTLNQQPACPTEAEREGARLLVPAQWLGEAAFDSPARVAWKQIAKR